MSAGTVAEVASKPAGARRRPRLPAPGIMLCFLFLAVVIVCAIAASLVAPYKPGAQNLILGVQLPSGAHLLGTDESGRDILSRIIAGAGAALVGPLMVAFGAMVIGTTFGLVAGYRRGWFDSVVMRVVDLMYSLPGLLVAIVALGVLGGGFWIAVVVLTVLTAPFDTRLIRGATLEQRGLPYVDAARTLGISDRRIMVRHIWPNIAPLIVANSFLNFAAALVGLASLSFLGLGGGPGSSEWGQMLNDNLPLLQQNPLAVLAPGIALVLLALTMNLIGDWAFERLSDRGRGR